MIKLIAGLPGSGKSLLCTAILREFMQNYAQAADQFAKKYVDESVELAAKGELGEKSGNYYEGLRRFESRRPILGQELQYRPVFTINFAWNMNNPDVQKYIRTQALRPIEPDKINDNETNFRSLGKGDDGYEVLSALPPGAVLLIDECQFYFPAVGKLQEKNSAFSRFLAYLSVHRHQGVDIYFVTQDGKRISPSILSLVGEFIYIDRPFGLARSRVRYLSKFGSIDNKVFTASNQIKVERQFYDKKLFSLYSSSELHTIKANIPKKIIIIAVVLIIMFFAGLKLAATGMKGLSPKKTEEGSEQTENKEEIHNFQPANTNISSNTTTVYSEQENYGQLQPYDGYNIIKNLKGKELISAIEVDDNVLEYAPYDVHNMRLLGIARFGNNIHIKISATKTPRYGQEKKSMVGGTEVYPEESSGNGKGYEIFDIEELAAMGYEFKYDTRKRGVSLSWGGSRFVFLPLVGEL